VVREAASERAAQLRNTSRGCWASSPLAASLESSAAAGRWQSAGVCTATWLAAAIEGNLIVIGGGAAGLVLLYIAATVEGGWVPDRSRSHGRDCSPSVACPQGADQLLAGLPACARDVWLSRDPEVSCGGV